MKEGKKTTISYMCKNTQQMQDTLLEFIHFCLVSVFLSGPSLVEVKFCRNYFPYFLFFLGVSKPSYKNNSFQDSFCYSPLNTISHCVDKRVYHQRQDCIQTSATNTQLAISDFQTDLMQKGLLPSSTPLQNGCYYALLLTSVYTTSHDPQVINTNVSNTIFCWTSTLQAHQVDRENKQTSAYTCTVYSQ